MTITIVRRRDPEAARHILTALPDWFGIPQANTHCVRAAGEKLSYLALAGEEVIGLALVDRHFPQTGEIHLIAVLPEHHGTGAGSALVAAIEADLRADGALLLEVKTVGESYADAGYAATRGFYLARGFLPLEEVDGFDWDGPTLIMVKPLVVGGD